MQRWTGDTRPGTVDRFFALADMHLLRHSECIPRKGERHERRCSGSGMSIQPRMGAATDGMYVWCDPHTAFQGGCAQEHASHVSAPLKWAHIKFRDSSCEDMTAHVYVPDAARTGYPRSSGRKFGVVSPGVCLVQGHLSVFIGVKAALSINLPSNFSAFLL